MPSSAETAPVLPVQRHLFDIPDDIAYLNCAYLSPLMHRVLDAGRSGLARKARPWEITAKDFWEGPNEARQLFAQLVNGDSDGVALIPSASYGMALAALNLPFGKGQSVVVLEDQFPSGVTHWADLAATHGARMITVARPDDDDWTPRILDAINAGCAVVSLPNCHWTDGTLIDLVAVGRRCREVGAALALDLTQSAGAMPVDVSELQPDFLVAAGYKWLMAPYSTGFVWVAPQHRNGRALELGYVARAAHPVFGPLMSGTLPFEVAAHRLDVGESANFALVPAACAALKQLLAWDPTSIQATLRAYTAPIAAWARENGLRVADESRRAGHYVGLRFPGNLPHDATAHLARHGVHVSRRIDTLRITPHIYNTVEDRTRLLAALAELRDITRDAA